MRQQSKLGIGSSNSALSRSKKPQYNKRYSRIGDTSGSGGENARERAVVTINSATFGEQGIKSILARTALRAILGTIARQCLEEILESDFIASVRHYCKVYGEVGLTAIEEYIHGDTASDDAASALLIALGSWDEVNSDRIRDLRVRLIASGLFHRLYGVRDAANLALQSIGDEGSLGEVRYAQAWEKNETLRVNLDYLRALLIRRSIRAYSSPTEFSLAG